MFLWELNIEVEYMLFLLYEKIVIKTYQKVREKEMYSSDQNVSYNLRNIIITRFSSKIFFMLEGTLTKRAVKK